MSSLPPRQPVSGSTIHQGATTLNRAAKRDPALYPLVLVVGGIFATAGYFLMNKAAGPDPAKKFMKGETIQPWDDSSKLDTHPSQVAAFKYRYKNREGHMEDSLPTLNEDVRTISSRSLNSSPQTITPSSELPKSKIIDIPIGGGRWKRFASMDEVMESWPGA